MINVEQMSVARRAADPKVAAAEFLKAGARLRDGGSSSSRCGAGTTRLVGMPQRIGLRSIGRPWVQAWRSVPFSRVIYSTRFHMQTNYYKSWSRAQLNNTEYAPMLAVLMLLIKYKADSAERPVQPSSRSTANALQLVSRRPSAAGVSPVLNTQRMWHFAGLCRFWRRWRVTACDERGAASAPAHQLHHLSCLGRCSVSSRATR